MQRKEKNHKFEKSLVPNMKERVIWKGENEEGQKGT